jgi:hypothetical protein
LKPRSTFFRVYFDESWPPTASAGAVARQGFHVYRAGVPGNIQNRACTAILWRFFWLNLLK